MATTNNAADAANEQPVSPVARPVGSEPAVDTSAETAAVIESEAPPGASTTVAAVCVDVQDLGVVDTPWGRKPKMKFVFELAEQKANGYPATASQTFTKSLHEKSALRPVIEAWLGRLLSSSELAQGFPYQKLKHLGSTLTLLPAISEAGNGYLKIVAIQPAVEPALRPSGTYRRWKA